MFTGFSTAQLDVAPYRARLVWAAALDDYLDGRELRTGEPALRRVRDTLRDPAVVVPREDLLRVRAFLLARVGAGPGEADEAARRARDLADGFAVDGRR